MKRQYRRHNKRHKKKSLSYKIEFVLLNVYAFFALLLLVLLALSYIRVVFVKTYISSAPYQDTTIKIDMVTEEEAVNVIEAEIIEEPEIIPYEEEPEIVEFCPIEYRYVMNDEEFSMFVRCVESEVTGTEKSFGLDHEDVYEAKLHVAQVILNRIESPHFPNTVEEVIWKMRTFDSI